MSSAAVVIGELRVNVLSILVNIFFSVQTIAFYGQAYGWGHNVLQTPFLVFLYFHASFIAITSFLTYSKFKSKLENALNANGNSKYLWPLTVS